MDEFDVCIVGAGVIGLAIAHQLQCVRYGARPLKILLLESEESFGRGISSRNSEVIHAGLYYRPESLKAKLCNEGRTLLYEYCQKFSIPYRRTGKLVIAQEEQVTALLALRKNATLCGVDSLVLLDRKEIVKCEPQLSGTAALLATESGIVDSHSYMLSLLHRAESSGLLYVPRTRVERIDASEGGFMVFSRTSGIETDGFRIRTRALVNTCGLGAVALARSITGFDPAAIPRVYPCKGSYFDYGGTSPFRHLIYPLPEQGIKGLGIHGTLDIAGRLKFGPDAEYIEDLDFSVSDASRERFAVAIKRYFPSVISERLRPAYSGIRPKLSGPGEPAADFLIQDATEFGFPGLVQLFGIESPGLTASLAIGNHVRKTLLPHFE